MIEPVHVEIEPSAIRAVALAPYSPQRMSPAIVCAVISEAFALRVHRKARRPFAGEGNGRRKIEAKGAVTSSANGQRFVLFSGILVHDMDDADKRSGAIGDRGWAAHHFNTFDVIQVERRQGGIEGAAPGHAVHHKEECVKLFQSPEIRHGAGWTGISTGCDLHASGKGKRAAQVVVAAISQLVAVADFERGGNIQRVFSQASGCYLHRFMNYW